jgi:hypothetical protein
MKYHKKLERRDVLKHGWARVLMMIASELSRSAHLPQKSKEAISSYLRAKELLGVLESDPDLPNNKASKMLLYYRSFNDHYSFNAGKLYTQFMKLSSST